MKTNFTEKEVKSMIARAWTDGYDMASKGKEKVNRDHLGDMYANNEYNKQSLKSEPVIESDIKDIIINIIYLTMVVVFFWASVSTTIQSIKCPKITQTELFLHIPQSFICNWQQCAIKPK